MVIDDFRKPFARNNLGGVQWLCFSSASRQLFQEGQCFRCLHPARGNEGKRGGWWSVSAAAGSRSTTLAALCSTCLGFLTWRASAWFEVNVAPFTRLQEPPPANQQRLPPPMEIARWPARQRCRPAKLSGKHYCVPPCCPPLPVAAVKRKGFPLHLAGTGNSAGCETAAKTRDALIDPPPARCSAS